ncbi:MAG TPA: tRNA (pseudouridine(54)-N(1))-methyltransferase TrmY [Thermoplasmata archaeon]|nr:tRNA (pseudouridine(54)-N(1))-methyltransferase TrmY [Thermoplasmata archaeon]
MRRFLIVGHRASTSPTFSLDDLAGSAGRMDILLHAANAALLIAHGIRRESEAALLLLGPPDPPRLVRLIGHRLRGYQPDIRSNAALVRAALANPSRVEREVMPGLLASRATLEESLDRLGPTFVELREDGTDIRETDLPADATFLLSDNQDLTADEERIVRERGALVVSVGPAPLHADQAIAIVQNELDRRNA